MSVVVHQPPERRKLASLLVFIVVAIFASLYALTIVNAAVIAGRAAMKDGTTFHFFRYRNTADVPWHDGFLLTFSGTAGIAWAAWLGAGTLVSLVLTMTPSVIARRLGGVVLLAHSGLWLANSAYMVVVSQFGSFFLSLAIHGLGFAITLLYLRLRWSRRPSIARAR